MDAQLKELCEQNRKQTAQDLREAIGKDHIIIQTIGHIRELDRAGNMLSKRLREWAALSVPEVSRAVNNHENFARLLIEKSREELLEQFEITQSVGCVFSQADWQAVISLALQVVALAELRKKQISYLEEVLADYAPNLLYLAGGTIAAELLELARGLKQLALLPASTVQLLGAEKALFRHLREKAKSPKHGVILNHYLLQQAKRNERGKVARALADKLSLCARLDYFKGEFCAEKYKQELEERFA